MNCKFRILAATAIAAGLAGCVNEGELVVDQGVGITTVLGQCPAVGIPDYTGDITAFRSDGDQTAGNLDVTASISDDAGNTETDTDTVALDTEVVNYTSADQNDTVNVNLEDMQQGFTLQGTVEQGSSVSVEINGTTHDATVD